jgi:hypothetical protein
MLNVKLNPHEIQLTIAAIHNIQIAGKDAHMVSDLLKKYEEQLDNIKPVKKG